MNDFFPPADATQPPPAFAPWQNVAPQPLDCTRVQVDCELTYVLDAPCDFVFLIHASQGPRQSIVGETLLVEPGVPVRTFTDTHSANRVMRLQAPAGPLRVVYRALVDRPFEAFQADAVELPIHDLPDDVLRFLLPTRYCESDLLAADAVQLFGGLPRGRARVQAIANWVHEHIRYQIGATVATTTARDVFVQGAGVCRDFAHLAVTFCRALNIPARLVSGYARFPEPPADFHAIFEAYLGGGWVLFDPSGMARVDQVVRVATGRDAKDVAFATIFGPARMVAMNPAVSHVAESGSPAPSGQPVFTA